METEHNRVLKGNILIMEDDPIISDIAKTFLEEIGFKVDVCSNGEEAIKRYAEQISVGNKFDLVIMDLTIQGGMGGKKAIQKLLEIDKGAKVIVTSGHCNDPIIENFRDYGFVGRLIKPFGLDKLKEEVYKIIKE